MKKILSFVVVVFVLGLSVNAQDAKEYGPKAGNFGIGIAANPAFEYIGNFFGKTVNNSAPTADISNGYSLFGKYYTSDNSAIRAGISFGYDAETAFSGDEDQDKAKFSESYFALALGLEKRIGSDRVQAFYGPSFGVGIASESEKYTYGDGATTGDLLKLKYGSTLSVAIGGFAGVEYFLTKNVALGTEIGLGLNFSSTGKGTEVYEGMDDEEFGSKSRETSFGFNNSAAQMAPRGTIFLSIYF
jgi:hypothetical protein